jgi:hypothetical protein
MTELLFTSLRAKRSNPVLSIELLWFIEILMTYLSLFVSIGKGGRFVKGRFPAPAGISPLRAAILTSNFWLAPGLFLWYILFSVKQFF